MSASTTLNLADYTTVWDHNFSSEPNLNGFNTVWGDVKVQNGAAVLTSTAANGWPQAGFMITPSGASAGNGYGLYSITMSLSDNGAVEGPGGYACLWPSTNNWPGPELDLVEKQGANSGTNGYSTIHWAGSGGSNQYTPTMFPSNIDVTKPHTYAMDWEAGRITVYIDGQEIYTTTQNVPKDFADGGQNEAFGAGEEPAWAASQQGSNTTNQVQVYDISYSASTPGAGGGASSGASSGSSSTAPASTSGGGTTASSSSTTPSATGTPSAGTTSPNALTSPSATSVYVPDNGQSSYAASINNTTVVSSIANKAVFLSGDANTLWLAGGAGQTAAVGGNGSNLIVASDHDFGYTGGTGNTVIASGSSDTLDVASSKSTVLLAGTSDAAQVTGTGNNVWTATGGHEIGVWNSGNTIVLGSSGNAVYDGGSGNTIMLAGGAQNNVTWDSVLSNGDTIDVSQALAAANWDGKMADLSQYLSVASSASGLDLSVHANGGASAQSLLQINGSQANIGLTALLQHMTV